MSTPNMTAPAPAPIKSPPGTKTLLMGPPGSGKTHSLRTLVSPVIDPALKSFTIFTEPSGLSMLSDLTCEQHFHWMYVSASTGSLKALLDKATKLNTFSRKAIIDMQNVDAANYRQFMDMVSKMSNLTCDRCGKNFGSTDKLGTDWVVNLDSLSPLNSMCLDLVSGGKPMLTEGDWGAAIEMEKGLLNMLTLGHRCHFILLAHTTRETDETHGGSKIMPGALGKKFPQEIGRFFDDIVYSHIDGTTFKWSTLVTNVDAKARRLTLGKDFAPTFKPIFDKWKQQGGLYLPA